MSLVVFFVSRLRHIITKYCTFFLCASLNFFCSIYFFRRFFGFKWGDDILIYCYWYVFNSQLIFISNRSNRNAIQFSANCKNNPFPREAANSHWFIHAQIHKYRQKNRVLVISITIRRKSFTSFLFIIILSSLYIKYIEKHPMQMWLNII